MSPSGSLVQPQGPIWPRTSASANTVNVGLPGFVGGSPEPPLPVFFTSDFEQQAAAASAASSPTRRDMAGHIARLTGGICLGRLPRSSKHYARISMSVAIRFSRQGKKKSPFYRIVAADKRK